jgi:hypothetical protein
VCIRLRASGRIAAVTTLNMWRMGNALIDLAKADGLKVIGVVSSEEKARFVRDLGADRVINRKETKVSERVNEITAGRGVQDVDWDTQEGHYRVRIQGEWIVVPDAAVVTEPNRFGPAVVWPYNDRYGNTRICCFMPGAGT